MKFKLTAATMVEIGSLAYVITAAISKPIWEDFAAIAVLIILIIFTSVRFD